MERKIIDLTESIETKKKGDLEEQLNTNPAIEYKKYSDAICSISDINADIALKKQYSENLLKQINKISSTIMEDPKEQELLMERINNVFYRYTTEEELKKNEFTKGFVEGIVKKFTEEETNEIFRDFDINEKFNRENLNDFVVFLLETRDVEKLLTQSQDELAKISEEFNNEIDDILSQLDSLKYMNELKEQIEATEDEEEKKKLKIKLNDLYGINDLSIISDKIKNKGFNQLLKEANKNQNLVTVTRKALKILNRDTQHMYPSTKVFTRIFRRLIFLFNDIDKAKVITYVFFKYICKSKTITKERARFIIFFSIYVNKVSFFEEEQRTESYFYNKLKEMVDSINKD